MVSPGRFRCCVGLLLLCLSLLSKVWYRLSSAVLRFNCVYLPPLSPGSVGAHTFGDWPAPLTGPKTLEQKTLQTQENASAQCSGSLHNIARNAAGVRANIR